MAVLSEAPVTLRNCETSGLICAEEGGIVNSGQRRACGVRDMGACRGVVVDADCYGAEGEGQRETATSFWSCPSLVAGTDEPGRGSEIKSQLRTQFVWESGRLNFDRFQLTVRCCPPKRQRAQGAPSGMIVDDPAVNTGHFQSTSRTSLGPKMTSALLNAPHRSATRRHLCMGQDFLAARPSIVVTADVVPSLARQSAACMIWRHGISKPAR